MRLFFKWAEDKNLELPILTDVAKSSKKTVDEKASRGGIAHWAYPDAYKRQQYPDGWFMPGAADAMQKMGDHKPSRNG